MGTMQVVLELRSIHIIFEYLWGGLHEGFAYSANIGLKFISKGLRWGLIIEDDGRTFGHIRMLV